MSNNSWLYIRREYPPDYISLVVDMYEHQHSYKEIVEVLNTLYPNKKPLTYRNVRRMLALRKGEAILSEQRPKGVFMALRLDEDIVEFLRELPYHPSNFVNAILGMYIREYKLKKAQQDAQDNNNEVTRFG